MLEVANITRETEANGHGDCYTDWDEGKKTTSDSPLPGGP